MPHNCIRGGKSCLREENLLRYTDFDCPFGIFKLFLDLMINIFNKPYVSNEALCTGRMILTGLILNQQNYRLSNI